jgi:DNA-binding transcriptional regulator YhcF (GntR family)
MPWRNVVSGMLEQLAKNLERDIRSRGLVPGSRYQTGEEIARSVGTSVATANRALKLLAERDIVVRNHRSGTFVGPALANNKRACEVRMVSIFCPASERLLRTVKLDPLIEALLSNMPDVADVRVGYVPPEGDVDFVRDLLEPYRNEGRVAGVVAISCSYPVYRYLDESRCPLVAMGTLHPGQSFPSLDTDERQGGYLLTRYLLECGHRRLAMLSNSESCPGDHKFHDGVSEAVTEAELPHNALVLRTPRPESEVVRGQVQELLALSDPPTGFIVKMPHWVPDVRSAIQEQGKRVPEDVEIVFKALVGSDPDETGCAHVRPRLSNREVGQQVGRMLAQSRQHLPLEQDSVVVPYEFYGRESAVLPDGKEGVAGKPGAIIKKKNP